MSATPKIAIVALLLASLTAGCGASAEEKEAACWAKRQALIAEIAAVPTMEWGALELAYETRVRRWDWDKRLDSYPNRRHKEDEKVQEMLTYELPNC